jgi:hypothetical protein
LQLSPHPQICNRNRENNSKQQNQQVIFFFCKHKSHPSKHMHGMDSIDASDKINATATTGCRRWRTASASTEREGIIFPLLQRNGSYDSFAKTSDVVNHRLHPIFAARPHAFRQGA